MINFKKINALEILAILISYSLQNPGSSGILLQEKNNPGVLACGIFWRKNSKFPGFEIRELESQKNPISKQPDLNNPNSFVQNV